MLNILKKELNFSIITSLVYIVLGGIIIFNPQTTLNIVGKIISVLAIVYGIIISIINIANLKEEGNLSFGILLIIMGVALLIYPNSLSILLSLGISIWVISSSVSRIKFAILIKEVKDVNWVGILVSAIITLIIGIAFIFTPLSTAVEVTIISGILMIAYALFDIFEVVSVKRNINKIEKVLE